MANGDDDRDHQERGVVLTDAQVRSRKARNLAIALALAALVVLFYLVTVFKMGGNVANRPM
jgi:hypothetical protein